MTIPPPAHRRLPSPVVALAALVYCAVLSGVAAAEGKPAGGAPQDKPAEASAKKAQASPPMEFDKYYLVLLRRGSAWTPEKTPETQRIQTEHLAHLTRMAESGKMVAAGPFDEQQDPSYRGLCLYRTDTLEEARKLAEEDPAVKAGRLKVEVMAWYTEKGSVAFPKARLVK
ncbi:MAG TPA: YciI family protein [Myxococcaceae bacterium]|nr:YciI family protein [Myxococcaceae bacterium]